MTTFAPAAPITDFHAPEHAFLSNFARVPSGVSLEFRGRLLVGPTAEHVFQAAKAALPEEQDAILAAPTPGQAKKLGRKAQMVHDWNLIRFAVMDRILASKFSDPRMRELLLATGHGDLVEVNDWGDRYWGKDPRGNGQNMLGFLLMKTRQDIRREM